MRNVAYSCDLISQDLLLLLPLLPSSSSLSLSLSLYMRVCVSGCVLVLFYFVVGWVPNAKKVQNLCFNNILLLYQNPSFSFFFILTLPRPFVFLFLRWFKVIYRWFFNGDFSPRHFSPLLVVGTEELTALNDSVTVGVNFHQSEVKVK